MNLNQLKSFVSVHETLSFAKTARKLFLTQSAVSQQISSLENEIGHTLFERTRQSVKPTREGRLFFPYACHILSLTEEALRILGSGALPIFLHFVDDDGHDPIHKVIFRYLSDYPEAKLEIQPPVSMLDFRNASMLSVNHLYLVHKRWILDENIHFFPLGSARYSCIVTEQDPLAKKDLVSIDDIGERKIFLKHPPDAAQGAYMGELGMQLSRHFPKTQFASVQNLTRVSVSIHKNPGKGISFLPEFVHALEAPGIVHRPFRLPGDSLIGFACTGEISQEMRRFLERARGCYENY